MTRLKSKSIGLVVNVAHSLARRRDRRVPTTNLGPTRAAVSLATAEDASVRDESSSASSDAVADASRRG
jgi:hypothetical protein